MAESAASAPPPRPGPPLIPPPRASQVPAAAFEAGLGAAGAGGFGGFDSEDEALPALAATPVAVSGALAPASVDEDGPPLEELEAQMRGEVAARDEGGPAGALPAARRRSASAEDDDEDGAGTSAAKGPLPEIDDLVTRLPAEVRDTLEELFRARFVAVKKLPKKLLQPATRKASTGGAPA